MAAIYVSIPPVSEYSLRSTATGRSISSRNALANRQLKDLKPSALELRILANSYYQHEDKLVLTALTPETIDSTIQSPLPVAVFFTSPSCGPCRVVYPILESLEGEYAGRLTIVKADVETLAQWCQDLNIRSIPRIVIFSGGKELKRIDPRTRGDMRLQFDAVCAAATTDATDAAKTKQAQEALTVYQNAVSAAQTARASAEEAIRVWFTAIAGAAADAADAAFEPLNQATDEALAKEPAYQAMDDEAKGRIWVLKREELKGEARFAEVLAKIEAAEAEFDKVAEPHYEERGRRYNEAEEAFDAAIQAARQAYKDKTGNWPS